MRWLSLVLLIAVLAWPVATRYGHRWLQLRQLRYRSGLTHRIVVEPDGDGRPGETFLAPSLSPYLGRLDAAGTRSDCMVVLSPRLSVLLVVCLGPSTEADVRYDAALTVSKLAGAAFDCVEEPAPATMVGEQAWRYEMNLNGRPLREWKLDHGGWRYAIGVLLAKGDGQAQLDLAHAVLSTWRWLEPARSS